MGWPARPYRLPGRLRFGRPRWNLPADFAGSAGSVAGTLVLSNGTVVPGKFLPFHGTLPSNVVFDGALGDLYVTNLGNGVSTGNVSVVNASTAEVVGSIR